MMSYENNSHINTDIANSDVANLDETTEECEQIHNWDDLDAKIELLRGIYSHGFQSPSPIQRKAIIPLFKRRDIIAQAQSGTGKTACFVIGSLQIIDETILYFQFANADYA